MHELPVAERILEIALKAAREADAKEIVKIHLAIGQLSSFLDDSIQFYWGIIAQNSIAEGAQLEFRRIPAMFRCQDCEREFAVSSDSFQCPSCASDVLKLISGNEFFLEAIDVNE